MTASGFRDGPPFSTAWVSERFYRHADADPLADLLPEDEEGWGTPVEFSRPWPEMLTDGWQRVVASDPEAVPPWLDAYREASHLTLVVTFNDARHLRLSRAREHVGVSYPADAIVEADDPVEAFVTAILAILDRHVDASSLPVPRLSEVCRRRAI